MNLTRSFAHKFWCFSCLFLLLLVIPSAALNLDGTLLLSFKNSILNDTLSVLDNWNYDDETPCLWTGVTCEIIGGTPDILRVVSLVLPTKGLLGSIAETLGFIDHLRTLDLSNNFLNGTLPSSLFFNAPELQVLSLSNNTITGNIPNGFRYVEVLDLSLNFLNGTLPVEFGGDRLTYLNLSSNNLSDLISPQFAKNIPENATIDLSFNNLTGKIPESTALSNQKPESFRGNLDLCGKPLKKLCAIPSNSSAPPPNISTNSPDPAIAAIPHNIVSQHKPKPGTIAGIAIGILVGIGVLAIVCLYVYQLKKKRTVEASKEIQFRGAAYKEPKNSNNKDSELSIAKETTRSLSSWPCLTIRNGEETSEATASDYDENDNQNIDIEDHQVDYYHNKEQQNKKYQNERSLVMVDGKTELELETLFKASAYILGSSAAASIVYKAVLEDGTAFAVKRIGERGFERFKEFENQVKAIAKLKHPNLVLLRGFYWGDDEKLVIYDYISNGSLANASYRKIGSSPYRMPLQVRLKIARGVARGLAYIHEKKHVHGNIKPSNILLTQEMEPIISDFGLHWLVHGKNSYRTADASSSRHFGSTRSTTTIVASPRAELYDYFSIINERPYVSLADFTGCTSPYHAPESLKNLKPKSKWDVYSFGIVLLELLTGRVFSDRELGQWTAGLVMEDKNRVLRMADVALRGDVESREDAIVECFKLGFSCASLTPQKRPSMKDALQILEKIACSPSC
ncbi:hypothetical protein ACH5RR_002208 [Cinchona calisaya]|uniref:Protein kinase domain-containing protein n=1 Tax=Cinchona calisaya TaxID=153742 RepID=A0ABD3B6X5_9GENT